MPKINIYPLKQLDIIKKKHYKSKCITGVILKSINTKDKLYKTLVKTDSQSVIYQTLKKIFQQFQKTLKCTIRMAKKNYFHRTFNLYKGDIKKAWLIINKTLGNKKKLRSIPIFQHWKQTNIRS